MKLRKVILTPENAPQVGYLLNQVIGREVEIRSKVNAKTKANWWNKECDCETYYNGEVILRPESQEKALIQISFGGDLSVDLSQGDIISFSGGNLAIITKFSASETVSYLLSIIPLRKKAGGFKGLNDSLRDGNTIRAFRSGGGLRVIRIENSRGTLVGYGESYSARPALVEANNDYLAGGLPYECVYLTGTSAAESYLDAWVLSGKKFKVRMENGRVFFRLTDSEYGYVAEVQGKSFAEALGKIEEYLTPQRYAYLSKLLIERMHRELGIA